MLRKTYRVQSVRSVRTLPAHLYHRRDFERRKRAMRYIKEEHDYITSARRNNIMFDMAMYKLDQMIAEMESCLLYTSKAYVVHITSPCWFTMSIAQ